MGRGYFKYILGACCLALAQGCSRPAVPNGQANMASLGMHQSTTTTCSSCHDTGKNFDAYAASGITPGSLVNQMVHNASALPDCYACHRAAALSNGFTTWNVESNSAPSSTTRSTVGIYHGAVTSNASCLSCHTGERPPVPAGSPIPTDHSTSPGNGDCLGCHQSGQGLTWTVGQFSHAGMNASTQCLSCHTLSEMPAAGNSWKPSAPRNGFDPGVFNHASTYGTACETCHTVVTANIGVTWKGGYFSHNNNGFSKSTSCAPCHGGNHKLGTTCYNCHSVTWPQPNSNGKFGGSLNAD